ncbi:glycosyltransferase family 2 protein [Bacillus sp. TH13]|uniref:glycosyltransferase family 2 protein n=1 Tax=Bacillus sp. TH13 TaxID=2796379 RepID=UPI0019115EA6|nr:glycosyltransferase family 2 protein [Bacillus sp. TH13]MBK5491853.1 glycosyltransferase family 2 protein [Bacillus sp. TH13]
MLTSIIILTHNQLQYTQECIYSIRKYTVQQEYELIVVDNASTDGTVEWLQKQSDILLVKNAENMGFPKGCNQGIKKAKGENILLLNNDVVVTDRWLSNLIQCLNEEKDAAAVGPVTNSASYYSAIPTSYRDIQEMQEFASLYNQSDKNKWEERMKLIGFCMLIKKSVLDEIGLLDERFTPGNYEDDDLSLRIFEKGYKLYLCRDTFVHHYGSVSWREDSVKFSMTLNENNGKFCEKWGFYSEGLYIYYDLLEILDRCMPGKVNMLHVGAGCGATLLEMKSRYSTACLFGAEVNEKAAVLANRIAPTICSEYNKLHEVFGGEYFYFILLSHPIEPEQLSRVIQSISQILAPTGTLIMSKFNLANYIALQSLKKE